MDKTKLERHERMYGPHFTEEVAMKVVKKMENEDGTRGPRWSVEEAERIAAQYGVNLKGEKGNPLQISGGARNEKSYYG